MKKLFLLLSAFIFSTVSYGKTFKLVELDELSVDAYDIIAKRDPFFPDMTHDDWAQGANFNINTSILKYGFWNNRLHLSSDQTQVRHVGWEFRGGIRLLPDVVDIYYHHHSEHVAEDTPPQDIFSMSRRKFPVQDYVGLRIYFYKKDK